MKNLYIYYLTIGLPLGIILWLNNADWLNSLQLFSILFFYLFVFRTYVDGRRLYDKNLILKKDIWKMIIPGKHIEFFKELYFK